MVTATRTVAFIQKKLLPTSLISPLLACILLLTGGRYIPRQAHEALGMRECVLPVIKVSAS